MGVAANKKRIIVIILAGAILIAGLCLALARQNISPKETPVPETLLAIETRGGLCPNGPCDAKIEIRKNGSYSYKNDNGKKSSGTLSASDTSRLEELAKNADFEAIKSKKFTGTCPTDYDGQEFIYTFYPSGQVIPACTYDINYADPMFKLINDLLSAVYSNLR
jgi:hypothetical protein